MARIVAVGGGMVGLATALMLARDGHDVTVLERDADEVPASPGEAWDAWQRPGVAQFRHGHYLMPAGSHILAEFLPEAQQALVRAGAISHDLVAVMPPFITDRAPRPEDARFVTVCARRPVLDYALAAAADGSVEVRRGVAVTELVTGREAARGVPHVTGVRTSTGEQLAADLVIDAAGRASALPRWLAALGTRPPAGQSEDWGFSYYTRFFRSPTGTMPPFLAGTVTPFDCYSIGTLPADAGTWSVVIIVSSHDQALKELRHPDKWSALLKACPLHAHWLDGEPITEVLPMSGNIARYRRVVVDGAPLVTGLIAVGDSMCATNPSLGRGMTTGLMQALGTAEVARAHLGDPVAFARAHDQMIEDRVMPWYWNSVGMDRARKDQVDAVIEGRPTPAHDGQQGSALGSLMAAMPYDADLFRAFIELIAMLALPEEILARPGVSDRVSEIASEREPSLPPGPSRSDVLQLLA